MYTDYFFIFPLLPAT